MIFKNIQKRKLKREKKKSKTGW